MTGRTDVVDRLRALRTKAMARRKATELQPVKGTMQWVPRSRGSVHRYPNLFARIPLFAPVRRRADRDTDWHHGDVIETSWGRIVRFGPGLDIFDEDTLIGLLHVGQQSRLSGERGRLPVPLRSLDGSDTEEVTVLLTETTAYELNGFLGRDRGGKNLRATRESISRLAKTALMIFDDQWKGEGVGHFFSYIGEQDCEGKIAIQFDPALIGLLEHSYCLIDFSVRMQLTDLGKALHRFLSSQPPGYQIGLEKLMGVLGYRGVLKDFNRGIKDQLAKLVALHWLDEFEICGTGRKTPFVLKTRRTTPRLASQD